MGRRKTAEQRNAAIAKCHAMIADDPNVTQRAMAAEVGLSHVWVGQLLRQYPPPVTSQTSQPPELREKSTRPPKLAALPDDTRASARMLVSEYRVVAADTKAPGPVRQTAMELAADLMMRLLDLEEEGRQGAT